MDRVTHFKSLDHQQQLVAHPTAICASQYDSYSMNLSHFATILLLVIVFDRQASCFYQLHNKLRSRSIHMTQQIEWDSVQGVWLNNRAASIAMDNEVFPSPLYLFGYGSLCFKPGDLLGSFPSYIATVNGCARLFAQRSCDHRGTANFPGLVATLVQPSSIKEYFITNEIEDISCTGVVWVIPPDKAVSVIDELDFRERGGYNRQYIEIKFQENTPYHKAGEIAKALTYTGLINNPNFYLPNTKLEAINIISAASGISGENCEYLFKLLTFNRCNNLRDDYVHELAVGVWHRLGPWRARLFPSIFSNRNLLSEKDLSFAQVSERESEIEIISSFENASTFTTLVFDTNLDDEIAMYVWGSNEFLQLTDQITHETINRPERIEYNMVKVVDQVICGGSMSAVISTQQNLFCLFGSKQFNISNVVCAAIGHDHALILLSTGHVLAINDTWYDHDNLLKSLIYSIDDYNGLSLPNHEAQYKLLKLACGMNRSALISTTGQLYAWGERNHSNVSNWSLKDGTKLVDVACGLYHTVFIDSNGKVWSFGDNRHGSLGRGIHVTSSSRNANTNKINTVDPEPRLVEGLADEIMWQRVSCGWAHTIIRGVTRNGTTVVACWGRNDMGQFPVDISCKELSENAAHRIHFFHKLPDDSNFLEVWTGSEFTVVADDGGKLWSCGWNEHGNLGNNYNVNSSVWVPVLKGDKSAESNDLCQMKLSLVWEGALSCGGAHVLAITANEK